MIYHFVVEIFETTRASNQTEFEIRQCYSTAKGLEIEQLRQVPKTPYQKITVILVFQNRALFQVAGIPMAGAGEKG